MVSCCDHVYWNHVLMIYKQDFISSGSVGAGTPSKFQTNKCAVSGHALPQFFFNCSHEV
jgi:hypothetical protein